MQAAFFEPPYYGSFVKDEEELKPDEVPMRQCLVLAFDDHTENYLVADRETGAQSWRGVADVMIDCDESMKIRVGEDEAEPKGDPCPICKRPMPRDEDEDEVR